ncbi:helix-turn-helix transcriptional regulator [Halorussus halobius]|uniref:helix-turn-helix transcriptional regulator n=1 Tax=Halorussus halobius TaxID=1710537 RepID=UPI001091CA11|nr:hypothetical protein [Halorussus halobius]
MRSSAALLVGVLLVVSAVGVGASHVAADPARSATAPQDPAFAAPETADSLAGASAINSSANVSGRDATEMYVTVRENGDARWNVTARFALEDGNETAAFRELAQEYKGGNANVGFTRDTFERVLDRAATDVDREMALEDVSRTSSLGENETVGVLSLSFTWTNFTAVDGNRLVVGDAFWAGSDTWLPALAEDQSLTVEGPTGYYVASSSVGPNGTRIAFDGPWTFDDGDFAITYAPKRTATTTGNPTTTATGDFPLAGGPGLVVVVVVFGLGFGAYAISQRQGPEADVEAADDAGESRSPATSGTDPDEPAPDDGDDEPDDGGDRPPTELLSDEERVLRLLRDNDGRMKQADIVRETNWSNAKVSQLLSAMDDDDEVNKLRIGRENLITLPDEDVTDLD